VEVSYIPARKSTSKKLNLFLLAFQNTKAIMISVIRSNYFKFFRESLGLTQMEFAVSRKISLSYVSALETGRLMFIKNATKEKLSRAYSMTVAKFDRLLPRASGLHSKKPAYSRAGAAKSEI
jgi:transcriptional regulator with XRE-family HTH domain